MSTDTVIEVEGLHKSFGEEAVLRGIDFSIRRGEVTSLLGKSGAGKSVLMKCISGLVRADSGRITVNGVTLAGRRRIPPGLSYMFQNNALLDGISAFDNVALPLRERTRLREREIRLRVKRLFQRLDLDEAEDKFPSQLSGGMLKRVALARALALDPEIILFDEPTTGLDPLRKVSVLHMIERYQRQFGFTAVLVSHDLPDALFISDRIAILEAGKIAFDGPPMALTGAAEDLRTTFLPSIEGLRSEVAGIHPVSPDRIGHCHFRISFESLGERAPDEASALPDLRAAAFIRRLRRSAGPGVRLYQAGVWSVYVHFTDAENPPPPARELAARLDKGVPASAADSARPAYRLSLEALEAVNGSTVRATETFAFHLSFSEVSHAQTEN
ncbi:MAG: ATP-binding cassette domain-containing protein [Opitutales bacterium]|nr:ATP-binding cassette domain-containing protein [Opitutales bacterium]